VSGGVTVESSPHPYELATPPKPNLESQYRQVLSRLKLNSIDMTVRRDVLRDIYRELSEHPGDLTPEELLDTLIDRYEAQGIPRSRTTLHDILQMAQRQKAFDYKDQPMSMASPMWLAKEVFTEADFVCQAEADLVYAIVRAGLEVDASELAHVFLNDRNQVEYIHCMLDNLKQRELVTAKGEAYALPGSKLLGDNQKVLQVLIDDIEQVQIPYNIEVASENAHALARKAMVQRSQDFVASGNNYLLACRLQWEAVERELEGATLEDLRWFMASYASVIAGKLSQVSHDYASARPYYLAFFALVREEDPLWSRMRGLINPMLSYYWANAGRELDINIAAWNLSASSPAQIAVMAATHQNPELRRLWHRLTIDLAEVNPGILRRITTQLMMNRLEGPESVRTAEEIEEILVQYAPIP
jgi:hypothetical protein